MRRAPRREWRVPWHSQVTDFTNKTWRSQGCGIAALQSVIEFWKPEFRKETCDDLFAEGLAIGAYMPGVGWRHAGLVSLARQYGLDGYNADFAPQSKTPESPVASLELLRKALAQGPVIASVWKDFHPRSKSGHLVVVVGADGGHVVVQDPLESTREKGYRVLTNDQFLAGFRQRFICIVPRL